MKKQKKSSSVQNSPEVPAKESKLQYKIEDILKKPKLTLNQDSEKKTTPVVLKQPSKNIPQSKKKKTVKKTTESLVASPKTDIRKYFRNTPGNTSVPNITSETRTSLRQPSQDNIHSDAVQNHVPIFQGKNDIRKYFGNTPGNTSVSNITSATRTSLRQPSQDNILSDAVRNHVPIFQGKNDIRRYFGKECNAIQPTNQIAAGDETTQVRASNQSDASNRKTFTSKQLGEGFDSGLGPDQEKFERHASDVV